MDLSKTFDQAIAAGERQVQVISEDEHKLVLVAPHLKDGHLLLPPDKLAQPRFLTAKPVFHDSAGFIAYVNAFRDQQSRIFYDQDGVFVAVLDYHAGHQDEVVCTKPPTNDGGPTAFGRVHPFIPAKANPYARHGDHIATLKLKRSPEWLIWTSKSEAAMSQETFAEFLEDNLRDIIDPDPAEMVAVATGLQATVGANFRQAINQSNGTVKLLWEETIEGRVGGGDVDKAIPTTFKIGVRPFMGCSRYPVECKLRYRVNSGALRLHYKTLHLEPITEDAIEAIVQGIAEETGLRPALGAHNVDAIKAGI